MRSNSIHSEFLILVLGVALATAHAGDNVLATYTFTGDLSQDNGGFVAENLGVQNFGGQGAIFVRGDDPDEAIVLRYIDPTPTSVSRSFVEIVTRNVGQANGGEESLLTFRNAEGFAGQFSLRFVTSLESDQSFGPSPDPQPAGGAFIELRFDDGVSDTVALYSSRRQNGKWDAVRVETTTDRLSLIINGQVEDSAAVTFPGFGVHAGDQFRLGGQTELPAGMSSPPQPADGFTGRILSFAFGSLAEPAAMSTEDPPIVYAEAIGLPTETDAPCDLNADGYVDRRDVETFFQGYAAGTGDFNQDGTTDVEDVLAFAGCVADPLSSTAVAPADCCTDPFGDEAELGVLRLQYTGLSCDQVTSWNAAKKCTGDAAMTPVVYIVVTNKSDPDHDGARVWFEGEVTLGGVFDVAATAAGKLKLDSKVHVHIFDHEDQALLLQSIEVKTDCNDSLPVGSAAGGTRVVAAFDPAGHPLGGPAMTESDVLVWFGAADAADAPVSIKAFVETECGRERVEAGDFIRLRNTGNDDLLGLDISEHASKVAEIGFRFVGGTCSDSSVAQADGRWNCAGGPDPIGSGFVIISDKKDPGDAGARWFYSGDAVTGDEIVAAAEAGGKKEFGSKTYLHTLAHEGASEALQSVELRSDCGEPLRLGDRFGAFEVIMLRGKDAPRVALPSGDHACAFDESDGQLRVTASSAKLVVVAVDSDGNTGIASTDLAAHIVGSRVTARTPCDFSSKPRSLEFLYTANPCSLGRNAQKASKSWCAGSTRPPEFARVLITDRADPNKAGARVYFRGTATLGDMIVADAGTLGERELKKDLYLHVLDQSGTLVQTNAVHTSCSEPLTPGDSFGAFYVLRVD